MNNSPVQLSLGACFLCLISLPGHTGVNAQDFDLQFEVTGLSDGGVVQGLEGEVFTFEGYAQVSTTTSEVRGWTLSFGGSGGDLSFDAGTVQNCQGACKTEVINSLGGGSLTGLTFEAPSVVDPDKVPTAGPLAGRGRQGPGVVDTIVLNPTETIPAGTFRLLRFEFSVTVPSLVSGAEVVELKFIDGLQGRGASVRNEFSAAGFPTIGVNNGVSFDSFTFTILPTERIRIGTQLELPGLCGGQISGNQGETLEFDGFVRLETFDPEVQGWTLSLGAEGANVEFDKPYTEFCSANSNNPECKVGLINSVGDPGVEGITFDAPIVVDPNHAPTAGPLSGMGPQGAGIVEVVALASGSELPTGSFRVLRFRIRIQVPSVASGPELVRLFFRDGYQGPGQSVRNSASITGLPTLEVGTGLNLGEDCSFLVVPEGEVDTTYELGFDINGLESGDTIQGTPGQVLEFEGYATLDSETEGVRGWSISYGGTGGNLAFDKTYIEGCSVLRGLAACKVGVVNDLGAEISGIVFDATTVVDPNQSPSEGPLSGSPQGPGVIDAVIIQPGQSLPVGLTRVMQLRFQVTVPNEGSELVRLYFLDGLEGGGDPVFNEISVRTSPPTPPVGAGPELFLGSLSFQVNAATSTDGSFRRGDSDGSGAVDFSDAIALLQFLLLGTFDVSCLDAGDADDSGVADFSDSIAILRFLLLGTFVIPAPGPFDCGLDPTADEIECVSNADC